MDRGSPTCRRFWSAPTSRPDGFAWPCPIFRRQSSGSMRSTHRTATLAATTRVLIDFLAGKFGDQPAWDDFARAAGAGDSARFPSAIAVSGRFLYLCQLSALACETAARREPPAWRASITLAQYGSIGRPTRA